MKVTLIKPYKFGAKEKPIGTIVDVTNGFGEKLISKGIAKEWDYNDSPLPEVKNKKQEKVIKKNSNFTNNNQVEKPDTKTDK